jgi:hypothetical protein
VIRRVHTCPGPASHISGHFRLRIGS